MVLVLLWGRGFPQPQWVGGPITDDVTLSHTITLADNQAQQHLAENLKALDCTQPQLRPWVGDEMLNVEWVFARDKTLTALEADGRWW